MPFEYRRAEDVDGALALVTENPGAAFLGGGTNLVDRMKLGVTNPRMVIDVSRLPLAGVEMLPDGGVRIGATVRNSDLAAPPPSSAADTRCLLALSWPELQGSFVMPRQQPAI